ncbi:MAG: hypothetical protein ACC645_21035, partial [Pirellulales bacterium]
RPGLVPKTRLHRPPAPVKARPSARQADPSTPAEAVQRFLEAVRQGDDKAAGAMLTELARKKTQELDMVVAPPGSDTAPFEVGEAEITGEDMAKVPCTWTDLDSEGRPRTDEITWTLRRDAGSWRIAGMAAKIYPDRPPVVLNFEDPEEMLRQQQSVENEAIERANQQQKQARKTDDPFQTGPK